MNQYRFVIVSALLCLFAVVAIASPSKKSVTKVPAKKTQSTKAAPAPAQAWDTTKLEQEYQQVLAELKLASTEKPYLVINLKKMELEVDLKGVPVWSYPIKLGDNDSSVIQDFGETFFDEGHSPVRLLEGKYLFAGKKQTPDSILKIVSEASKVSPELLQRILPARFQLTWEGGLVLDCVTDISAQPESSLKNTLMELGQMLKSPFGLTRLVVKIDPDAAITLFRIAEPGLPTLINP